MCNDVLLVVGLRVRVNIEGHLEFYDGYVGRVCSECRRFLLRHVDVCYKTLTADGLEYIVYHRIDAIWVETNYVHFIEVVEADRVDDGINGVGIASFYLSE